MAYENATRLDSVDKWEWHSLGLGFGDLAEHYEDIGDRAKSLEYYIKSNRCYEHTIELNGGNITNPSGVDLEHNIVGVRKNVQRLIRLTTRSPQTAEDWFDEGQFFYCHSEYDEAIKAYDEAIKLNSSEPKYWSNKGAALSAHFQYEDAIKAYNEAIRLDPNYAAAWCNKAYDLDEQNKIDDAIKAYDEAIRLDPNLAEAWFGKGQALSKLGKYDTAIEAYDEAIKINPKDYRAWSNKGAILIRQGKTTEANAAYAKAEGLGMVSVPRGSLIISPIRWTSASEQACLEIGVNQSAIF